MNQQHLITVLVENKPGVLARVSSMFARRGFNIHSLAVGPTTDPEMSRMTVVAEAPEVEQIVKQLYKLVTSKPLGLRAGCDPTAEPGTWQCYENPDLERAGLYVITPEAVAAAE